MPTKLTGMFCCFLLWAAALQQRTLQGVKLLFWNEPTRVSKGPGSPLGPSEGCFVLWALPVESDKQLVLLCAARIEIFPVQVSIDIPSSSIDAGAFHPSACALGGLLRFATCVPTPVPTRWPPLQVVLELQSPPVPSLCCRGGQAFVHGQGAATAAACRTSAWRELEGCCLWYQPASLKPNDCLSLEGWAVGTSLPLSSKDDLRKRGGKEFLLLSKTSTVFSHNQSFSYLETSTQNPKVFTPLSLWAKFECKKMFRRKILPLLCQFGFSTEKKKNYKRHFESCVCK